MFVNWGLLPEQYASIAFKLMHEGKGYYGDWLWKSKFKFILVRIDLVQISLLSTTFSVIRSLRIENSSLNIVARSFDMHSYPAL